MGSNNSRYYNYPYNYGYSYQYPYAGYGYNAGYYGSYPYSYYPQASYYSGVAPIAPILSPRAALHLMLWQLPLQVLSLSKVLT